MKIEKTSSPAFRDDCPESFPHENDVRNAFNTLKSRNGLRLHHCARHPEDMGLDYVIEYLVLYLEKTKGIAKDELESIRGILESGLASDMVDGMYSDVKGKEKLMEQALSEFDWPLFYRTSLSMNMLLDQMKLCNMGMDTSPESERERFVAAFVCGIYHSLSSLLDSFAAKGIASVDLRISDVIGYARFDVRCRVRWYCAYEHLLDSLLEDYISRIMPKASVTSGIKVNLVS